MTEATAFAPATVANVAVGFDILGFALDGVGDTITVARTEGASGVLLAPNEDGLPSDPLRNTASVAALAMLEGESIAGRFHIRVEKGIALGSGMGGSAASAVGAVVALNAFLESPLGPAALLPYALAGEAVASGAPHADNVAPCLFGGLVASVPGNPGPRIVQIPPPPGIECVLVRPHVSVRTAESRAALPSSIPLELHVRQSARLAGFLSACFRRDRDALADSMRDEVVEPHRAAAIPGFHDAQAGALEAGALGCSISGSGPAVFAWTDPPHAAAVEAALVAAFSRAGVASDAWRSPVGAAGARRVRWS